MQKLLALPLVRFLAKGYLYFFMKNPKFDRKNQNRITKYNNFHFDNENITIRRYNKY